MIRRLIPVVLIACLTGGCKLQSISYSMSGITLGDEKTFSVEYFTNNTSFFPELASEFTEDLKAYLRSKTPLNEVTDGNGDIRFSGKITSYTMRAMDIRSNEEAAKNRITLTIQVKFENDKNDKFDFDQSFSHYEDIGVDEDFDGVINERLKKITEKIIEDVFNKSLVNW